MNNATQTQLQVRERNYLSTQLNLGKCVRLKPKGSGKICGKQVTPAYNLPGVTVNKYRFGVFCQSCRAA